ncbi:MAG: hypothetical protein KGL18_07515 [Burkholderiales bacterium]|nr:hypothetical protein [Burkholderiales bacterium]MDE1926066.1 hypothetical protein [Burkholderiales bacterium]MDE2502807.1 hypothetical protein [Burkholderiales bacterium]
MEFTDVSVDQPRRLQLRIDFESIPSHEDVLSRVADACNAFCRATDFGAFARQGGRGLSFANLVRSPVRDDRSLLAEIDFLAIDNGSLQFLRNMLLGLNDAGALVKRLALGDPGSSGLLRRLPLIDHLNESSAYPRLPGPISMGEIRFAASDFSKSRRVLIEFDGFPRRAQIDALESCLGNWYDLLELGAFCQPFGTPGETVNIRGRLARFDSSSVEAHIQRYVGSEVGFKVLGSMLDHYAGRVHPIVGVEVD